jgi:hypothetical protein
MVIFPPAFSWGAALGYKLPSAVPKASPAPPKSLGVFPEMLKEELFQLEADRARGSISAEEYCSARLALEETVKRDLAPPNTSESQPTG